MQEVMDYVVRFLPIIIPLAIIQFGLLTAALIHIFKHNTYKAGNRVLWVVISIGLNTLGPILYFIIGRSDD